MNFSIVCTNLFAAFKCLCLCCSALLLSNVAIAQVEYYIPKALVIPVHTAGHQLHTSLGAGGGMDVNVSYALTDRLALFTTATINKGRRGRRGFFNNTYSIQKSDYAFTGGAGYFKRNEGKFINHLETFVGFGNYKVDNFQYTGWMWEGHGYETDATYWNLFWQLNAIHKVRKHELAAALRVAYSTYVQLEWLKKDPNINFQKNSFEGLRGLTFEPFVSYSFLHQKIKFNCQLGFSG